MVWNTLLWFLSGRPVPEHRLPPVPGADKLVHFAYFFLGALLLAGFLTRRAPTLAGRQLLVTVTVILALIGLLDEWHQSWIPERSGNDLGDWLADSLGAFVGTLFFLHVRPSFPTAHAGT
mgnify:CR=1 FL=1